MFSNNRETNAVVKKVLVVDDNPVSRELIREVLEDDKCKVLEAENGEEALKMIGDDKPDIVLLDIQLPVYDGYEVLYRVRTRLKLSKLPVLALTAYAMQGDREKALDSGFDAYITKPIDAAALRLQVNKILDSEP
jgi:two-component system cell cycle response regulator DivK